MENAVVARRRSGLAKGLFAVSLLAVGAAALSPDWAAALKAQGYYGSVDLGVTLTPSQTPRAGETVDFLVTVRNGGPDAANRVRTIAGAQNLHVLETDGCAADPLGYPQCALPSPLAAGASGDYLLRMKVPTLARGNMVLSVSATSDDDEIAPGDEVALFKAPIVAQIDLGMTMHCNAQAFAGPTARIVCDFDVRNDGPSAAAAPSIFFYLGYGNTGYWTCTASRPGLCPAGTTFASSYHFVPVSIEPGEALRVRSELLPPTPEYPMVYVDGRSRGQGGGGETETNYNNNDVFAEFDTTLFRDDFEPTSNTPTP
jgi:hypothetical protein